MTSVIVDAVNLNKTILTASGEAIPILRGVSFSARKGEFVTVVGRSGSGKSSLLALLGLLDQPDSGTVTVAGHDANRLTDSERSRIRSQHIGYVFQNFLLLPHLTVAQNISLPLIHGPRVGGRVWMRRVSELLEAVDLSERARAYPRHLSGGEQQRVAIARSLVRRPSLILADEPTGSLDVSTATKLLELLIKTVRSQEAALVLVTHDLGLARGADRVVGLHEGKLAKDLCE